MTRHTPWRTFTAYAAKKLATIDIDLIGEIGAIADGDTESIEVAGFRRQLHAITSGTVRLHVHSPGGNFHDAVAIAETIAAKRRAGVAVEAHVLGLAASAATLITAACHPVVIPPGAAMFVHKPITCVHGGAAELRRAADVLDSIEAQMVAIYLAMPSMQLSAVDIHDALAAETWMSAADAVRLGFATTLGSETVDPETLPAFEPSAVLSGRIAAITDRAPAGLRPRVVDLLGPTALDLIAWCRDAGCPDLALELVAARPSAAAAKARIAHEQAEQQAAADRVVAGQVRASRIRAACAAAGVPQLADNWLQTDATLDQVKAYLLALRPLLDRVEIDTTLAPEGESRSPACVDWRAAYRNFNTTT